MEKLKWGPAFEQRRLRDSSSSSSWGDGTNTYGFSWPPQRNYKCSFCKREFKSAQALGGHMNVHRRDRARMRLSPPAAPSSSWDKDSPNNCLINNNPNPIPNPNPNFPSPSSSNTQAPSKLFVPFQSSLISTSTATSLQQQQHHHHHHQAGKLQPPMDRSMPPADGITDRGKKNKGWSSSSSSSVQQQQQLELITNTTTFARRKDTSRVWKANEFVRLDLNLGLMIQDAKDDDDDDDDLLDLELRLGYSN